MLARHHRPNPGSNGASWLTFLEHSKDSLWSLDLFRCESLILNTHWVMVIMDHYSRRIIGFAVHKGTVDGPAVCRMLGRIVSGAALTAHLTSDNDPLFEFHRWKATLRIIEIEEIKTVPYVPISHPFVERLIGTIRRAYLDHVPFCNAGDLERKLSRFKQFYNRERAQQGIGCAIPGPELVDVTLSTASLDDYRWNSSCRGLYQLPAGGLSRISHPTGFAGSGKWGHS